MIDLSTVIEIIAGIIIIGGGIVGFFVMQKGQNMKISQLRTEVNELKDKQTKSEEHQNETEKFIAEINVKLEHIAKSIDEIKNGKS